MAQLNPEPSAATPRRLRHAPQRRLRRFILRARDDHIAWPL
jgi:hypothetical protein